MEIRPFEPKDLPSLHHILTSNRWEYFLDPIIDENGLKNRDEKYFMSDSTQTLVSVDDDGKVNGYIRFFDIENTANDSPDFILSVDRDARGKGVGTQLLQTGVKYIFSHYDKIRRIEASTREDNIPMQKTFKSAGFRQEARYVKEWENRETGEFVDSLGYAILREEFSK